MYVSPETFALIQELDIEPEKMARLFAAFHRDALSMAPPAAVSGVNEERERLRNESTYAERKRAKDRERQRRLREEARQSRDSSATSRDIDGDTRDKSRDPGDDDEPSRTQVVIPSLPSLRSEELIGGGVGETRALAIIPDDDWPVGKASDHAELLIATVASPWLDPSKSPDLVTTRGRVAAWKRDGASWEFDVVPVVTGLCANRRGRISSWKFFDQAVARSIAENRAALQIPEAATIVQLRATGPPRTIDEKSTAAWDYALKRIAEDG